MNKVFTILLTVMLLPAFAQRGPGGVSDDSSNERNCRLWVDAADLKTLNDLDPVTLWVDKSVSAHVDELFWNTGLTPVAPTFRNSLSAGINGRPAVSFDEGGMLAIGTWNGGNESANISPDLNSNADKLTTYEQTVFIVLRTGANVDGRQIIWEEGGSERGFTIHILNGQLRVSAYDRNGNDLDTGVPPLPRVPAFGFTYKTLPVSPNTTYTVSLLFKVPTNNTPITNTNANAEYFGLGGTLNGQAFPTTMLKNCCGSDDARVGGVFRHPDPIGIGAQNRTTYNESGPVNTVSTGNDRFLGRIAEIVYYAASLNPAERIIVENYLAAKYNSGQIANERYVHKNGFAEGLIGIGQESTTERHLLSQADNLFEMRVDAGLVNTLFPSNAPGYVMTGHNNGPLLWTDQNVPDPVNVQRLRRTWRFDHNGNTQPGTNLRIRINGNAQSGPQALPELPALPTGFTKYGIMLESTSPNFPNFSEANSTIVELVPVGGGFYEALLPIPDNAFFTICAFRPSVQFQLESDFTVEGNPLPPPSQFVARSATIELNYVPLTSHSVNVGFIDGTGELGVDYLWIPANSPVTFAPGQKTANIPFQVLYDEIENIPSARDFSIFLTGTGSPGDPVVGARDTMEYIIYDDDPDPVITFPQTLYTFNESAGIIQIPVQIIGDFVGPITATVRYVVNPSGFTGVLATPNVDFQVSSQTQTLTFNPGDATQFYTINLTDDNIHEFDESIVLFVSGFSGGIAAGTNLLTEVRITDNDPAPTINFVTPVSEGYRTVSNPIINVQLSGRSAKTTEIPFSIVGGTALNGAISQTPEDFNAAVTGTVIVPPLDTLGILYFNKNNNTLNIFVQDNTSVTEDRTILFELDDPVNGVLGSQIQHTYTIKPYSAFEFTGAGGVGRLRNNTVWMRPDLITGTGQVLSVPNISETNVQLRRPTFSGMGNNNNPVVPPDFTLNGNKVIRFNGTTTNNNSGGQILAVGSSGSGDVQGQHPFVNMSGQYSSKSIYMVIIPRNVAMMPGGSASTNAQILYEQGGQDRGLNLYIRDSRLHFAAYNRITENGQPGWGLNENAGGRRVLQYTTPLVNDQPYIISAHYDANAIPAMRLYVNGELVSNSGAAFVGRMFTHSGQAALGAMWNGSSIEGIGMTTGTTTASHFYNGDIAEFIYFDEPNLSSDFRLHETRNRIIHNYLSAKFNLPLTTGQVADLNFADASSSDPLFNVDLAGLGRLMDGPEELVHGISQGQSPLRVSAPVFNTSEAILTWAHNGESLTNTWPFSYGNASLPGDVVERSGRVWKFYSEPATGITNVDVEINFGSSSNAFQFANDRDMLRLLTHSNSHPNDFSNAAVYTIGPSQPTTGTFVTFSNVPVVNGMYMALGNSSSMVPLPIELLSFDARLNGAVVDLTWSTASETNNDFFTIERAGENLAWETLEIVAGAGNSNTRLNYATVDPAPLNGLNYYRLRQTDFDGSFSYSDVRVVRNLKEQDEDVAFLFPNPAFDGRAYVRLPASYSDYVTTLSLYDLSGRRVWQGLSTQGESLIEVSYGNLPSGAYLLEMHSEIFSETKKLVIQQ